MKALQDRTSRLYVLLLASVFLLAAPYSAPGGGYGCITGFKAAVWLVLTGLFLLFALPGLSLRRLFDDPWAVFAAGYLLWSFVSALLSPWKRTALLGSERREGFLTLAGYVLAFLLLRVRDARSRALLPVFAASVGCCALLSVLQLAGHNPLGLYPEGLRWQDAGLRYAGSYLGSVGNAGLTGAVISAAAALFFVRILRAGGRSWVLLPCLLLCVWVLGRADIFAPILALAAVVFLELLCCEADLRSLCRWLSLSSLLLSALLAFRLPVLFRFALPLFAGVCYLLSRFAPPLALGRHTPKLLALALLFLCTGLLLRYDGWYTPVREAAGLLSGQLSDELGSGRVYIWKQVLAAVPEHPLFGTGPDTLLLRELPPYVWEAEQAGMTVRSAIDAAHCEILQTLVCQGLPAAVCHLALFLCAAVRFFRERGSAAGICAAGALCYALQALVGISAAASAPVFWVLLAFSCNPAFKGASIHGSDE